ncbi:methyl-accepting chemotaxis protein [Bacillus sp. FSL R5-0820]|uniref:methyl-accepting chemotaxis protein n=1 Tax=Bacillus TaxID=1386 RepID=UPI000D39CEE0|nr:methyl-accepting chemotaxis protein [Bacillus altitudinis]QAR53076.1 methyl-accepting chemotaxis protein [Bacillus aerophilus]MDC7797010.1 methyl-accepting chemotaxis protein [Bacillus altitudinis]MDT1121342.1 methyl-accepting chemotaxis protein [Bacillus altitudinis]PUF86901.1 methyl-accepting chemotaxis protein [Bacillus altitudinis]PWN85491.1 methyl-accepting chemotaxis protein [Bacillus altitudinis]
MKKKAFASRSVFFQLMSAIIVITILTGGLVGTTGYFLAKNVLIDAGKADLKHIVNGAMATLEQLNDRVENKELTLEQAQEQARIYLSGPKNDNGKGYQFQKSDFIYKNKGYLVAYGADYSSQVHPVNDIGVIPDNTTNRQKMVAGATAKGEDAHYITYMDKDDATGEEKQKLAYMNQFTPWNWSIGIAVFQDEFYKELEQMKLYIILITAGVALLSMGVFYLAARGKVRLLKQVTAASKEIAAGNLERTSLKETSDEIGQLAKGFNHMSGELRTLVSGLQETSSQLVESATDLSAISEETSASSEEIGRAIGDISTGTLHQASDLEVANQQMTQFNQSIENVKEQSDQIKRISDQSNQSSEQGQQIVQQLKQSNEQSIQASQGIRSGIEQLSTKVQDISQITDTIESISNETNLLALNASIEAARAGEHGKGFSVVASEVRNLAEQTKQSAVQIQQMIQGIKEETTATAGMMSKTMDRFAELDEAVHATEQEFNSISTSISQTIVETNAMAKELNTLLEQNDLITKAMHGAAHISQENAAAIEEITASTDEQVTAISNVAKAAERLNELSMRLNQDIARYRL